MAQAVYVNKNGKAVKKSKRKRIFWGIYLLITVAAVIVDFVGKKAGWLPRDWSRISADTGVGNPLKASAEKGEKYARAVVDALARLVTDLCTKDLY